MREIIKNIEIQQGSISKSKVFSHIRFVEPMLDYIVEDFIQSRIRFGNHEIGAMVVCESAEQAKNLYACFSEKYNTQQKKFENKTLHLIENQASTKYIDYIEKKKPLTASLILHDIGEKESRKEDIRKYKAGEIDILFVYNMLLTGFDAKRLKKLYLTRVIKDHNLLQTLTRVNRPYQNFKYGYVVDFADISQEFDKTNRAYFDELKLETEDEIESYSHLFKSQEEIQKEIQEIKNNLFRFDVENAEVFSKQISEIQDKNQLLNIKKILENVRNLHNIIRLQNDTELLSLLDFHKLNQLYNEVSNHLNLIHLKDAVQNDSNHSILLNEALEEVLFVFTKISEEEMILADQLKNKLRTTREALAANFDPEDQNFVLLFDELKRLFKRKNLDEVSQTEMIENIGELEHLFNKIKELNRQNNQLKIKYQNDEKFVRLHKRIIERGEPYAKEIEIHQSLMNIKNKADDIILNQKNMVFDNEAYFKDKITEYVINGFNQSSIKIKNPASVQYISSYLVKQYTQIYK